LTRGDDSSLMVFMNNAERGKRILMAGLIGVGLAACSNKKEGASTQEVLAADQNRPTMTAPLPDGFQATEEMMMPSLVATETQLPKKTSTLTSTPTPTETMTPTPTETEEPTMTATPDIYNFDSITPEPAKINEAEWNGVRFKFDRIERSNTVVSIDPESTWSYVFDDGECDTVYFRADKKDLFGKVFNMNFFVKVTFSNGEETINNQGSVGTPKSPLRGVFGTGDDNSVGGLYISFNLPPEGMEIVRVEVAGSAGDKLTTLYEK